MPKPRVIEQPTSTRHLMMGINALTDLLAPTLGPVGGVVADQRDVQKQPELIDDSATTVRRILNLGDPRMDVGAMLMRSLVWRVVQRVGDGGATAAVLARALHSQAVRMIAAGANAMQMAKGVNLAVTEALIALDEQARPVHHENDLASVARTVVREPALAAVLGEMSYLLGPDAQVTVEKYVAPYLQQYYHPGASYKAQIASMYLYTDQIQKRAILPPGMLALVDGRLESVDQVAPLLEAAASADAKSLTIIAANFSEEVIGVMVTNNRISDNGDEESKGKLAIVGAKFKDVGDARRAAYDDLDPLTGATVLGRDWSLPANQATLEDLGRTTRVEVSTDLLHIVSESQNPADILERTAELRTRLGRMTLDDDDRAVLVKRISSLSGGMGVLKIGAESKLDREVRAKNAERALKVLSAAQHSGVVPGGGAAYFHCIPALADLDVDGDTAYGVEIVRRALAAPLRQILDNAHVSSSAVIMEHIRNAGPTATYDVLGGQVVDAYDAGIMDVANVLRTVLQTAISGALMAVTTDTIIYHKDPEQAFTP